MPSKSNLMTTYILLVFIWASTPLAIVWSVADLHMMWALVFAVFYRLADCFIFVADFKS